ncbi:helix-turn-helix domain-containing protein [Sporomusa malonica]|uniref:Cytoskeleton protein RodZ-like C-terminal domain-containing protein n=1 Tax=Sporomusa malonica TaxID=112901 RepID=A0A1W2AWF3_9FIRM|nr:RodZ domain-containing protein [Sporomusa malonica]SMC64771.1 protein of unknown function [Sporomusa malonica]
MQTVGEILRAERVKKSLSIKDVESAISIRALYLNAIEEGNYSVIPGEVYLKGFIRNYATFLGLNPQQVMEVYRQNKGQASELAPTVSQSETIQVSPASSGGGLKKWLIAAVVAAGVVAGLAWWSSGSQKPAPAPPPSVTQQPGPATGQQPPQSAPPTQSVAPAKSAAKVSVTAKYNAQCWTQIMADGKEIYEGIPKSGESLTWEATSKLTAKFGNANAVDLVYNGSPVGKIGGSGEVVVKTFTINGITQ